MQLDSELLARSYAECTRRAKAHYENFPVGLLVPAAMQPHVHAVYAFARYADDLADEGYSADSPRPEGLSGEVSPEQRLAALQDWENQLVSEAGNPHVHLIFPAVHDTIQKLHLPPTLFTDLLSAFQQDVVKRRYADFPELLDYCRRSANPVGRLVLLLHGIREESLHQLADHICTGLQLANFWQDVSVDLKKDRIYLPEIDRVTYGVTEAALFAGQDDERYCDLLRFQVARTRAIFEQGEPLTKKLHGKLRVEIRLTWLGGMTVLRKIEKLQFNTLKTRPKVSKIEMAGLFLQALLS